VTHVDTSFLIRALISGTAEDKRLRRWIAADESLAMSAVAWAEFLCGPLGAADATLASAIVGEATSLTSEHAARAAVLFNASGRRRGTFVDCLVAACAIHADAALATANPDDFARMPGVRVA
jgi:predicted nucleic acid-binding protein